MITMDMVGRIRPHSRSDKSEREFARITGSPRNTVFKRPHEQVDSPPKYQRGEQPTKLTAFQEAPRQALMADASVPGSSGAPPAPCTPEIKASDYDCIPRVVPALQAHSPLSDRRSSEQQRSTLASRLPAPVRPPRQQRGSQPSIANGFRHSF